jgi:hypothetical protein
LNQEPFSAASFVRRIIVKAGLRSMRQCDKKPPELIAK